MSRSITGNAVVVALMTLLSRVGGLVREQLLAAFFGTGVAKSAFDVAYTFPNLFRRLFGEGALSAALIPIYTETLEKDGKEEADRLAAGVAGAMFAFLSFLAVAGIVATFPVARFLADDSRWTHILPLLRIMLPYAPLICLAALVMGVLNSLKSFAVSAFAPALQNFVCIVAIACICPFLPSEGNIRIKAVAWSILVSGIAQVAIQLPVLAKHGVPRRLIFNAWGDAKVRRVFRLMMPMALAAGVVQVNLLLDRYLAMWAGEWGPSALGYADRLVYFPLAIFGTAFATALLPALSKSAANGDFKGFANDFGKSMASMCALMLPSAAGLLALARPVTSLIFEMGRFDATSTIQTSTALIAYSAGLLAFGAAKLAPQAFYAVQDAKTPVKIAVACVGLNFALNVFFVLALPSGMKPIGIAIATSISSTVQCVAMLHVLSRRRHGGVALFEWRPLARPILSALAASVAMGLVAWRASAWIGGMLEGRMHAKLACGISVFATIAIAAAAYAALIRLLCPSLLREAVAAFRRRRAPRK